MKIQQFLTPKQIDIIEQDQALLQKKWKSRSVDGEVIEYLGKTFVVLPNVFPPRNDSKGLVENLPKLKGKIVLDIGTGSGVIGIFAALNGAEKVIAVDVNHDAVRCAILNSKIYGFSDVISVFCSDLFAQVPETSKFDVITANLPFRNKFAPDVVAASQWDTNFDTHKRFFGQVKKYLKEGGYIYMAQANYPELRQLFLLLDQAGFAIEEIARRKMQENDPRVYFTFKIYPK